MRIEEMTFELFINEIVSKYDKKKGEYDLTELLEIGINFRSLPVKQRRWKQLNNIVGYPGSSDAYRMYVTAHLFDLNECNPVKINGISASKSTDEEIGNIQENLYIEKTKVRDAYNAYRATLRDEARIQSFKTDLVDAISRLEPLEKITDFNFAVTNENNEAILMLSDLHIGVECNNFYNKYNSIIAMKRLNKVVRDTCDYCRLHNIRRLNIVNLGDMINGIIHTTCRIQQEFDVTTQLITASEMIAHALNDLQYAAPEIIYRSCTDNHARVMADKNQHIEKENLCKIMDWYLKERLKDTKIVFANDNIDDSLGKFVLLNGKKVLFAHGHLDSINSSFENFVGATKEFVDYGLLAHYHCEKMKSFQGFKVFINGSIVGSEQYAISRRLFSNPSQTLLVFENNNVIDISIDVSINE